MGPVKRGFGRLTKLFNPDSNYLEDSIRQSADLKQEVFGLHRQLALRCLNLQIDRLRPLDDGIMSKLISSNPAQDFKTFRAEWEPKLVSLRQELLRGGCDVAMDKDISDQIKRYGRKHHKQVKEFLISVKALSEESVREETETEEMALLLAKRAGSFLLDFLF